MNKIDLDFQIMPENGWCTVTVISTFDLGLEHLDEFLIRFADRHVDDQPVNYTTEEAKRFVARLVGIASEGAFINSISFNHPESIHAQSQKSVEEAKGNEPDSAEEDGRRA